MRILFCSRELNSFSAELNSSNSLLDNHFRFTLINCSGSSLELQEMWKQWRCLEWFLCSETSKGLPNPETLPLSGMLVACPSSAWNAASYPSERFIQLSASAGPCPTWHSFRFSVGITSSSRCTHSELPSSECAAGITRTLQFQLYKGVSPIWRQGHNSTLGLAQNSTIHCMFRCMPWPQLWFCLVGGGERMVHFLYFLWFVDDSTVLCLILIRKSSFIMTLNPYLY